MNVEDALLIIVNEIIRIKNITDPLRNIEEDEPLMEIAREMLEQLRQGERSESYNKIQLKTRLERSNFRRQTSSGDRHRA